MFRDFSDYGKTGYAYLLNDNGVVISHPKYSLKDNLNLTDPSQGELATLVKNEMLPGKSAIAKYVFRKIEKYAFYTPLRVGAKTYCFVATCPVSELMDTVNAIRTESSNAFSRAVVTFLTAGGIIAILGALLGLVFAARLARSLDEISASVEQANLGADVVEKAAEGIHQIDESTGTVAPHVLKIASASSEQSEGIGQINDAVAQMDKVTQAVAASAQEA